MRHFSAAAAMAVAIFPIPSLAADAIAVERARSWYQREIPRADHACEAATRSLQQSEKLLERAETIARSAPPSDEAGRSVAMQAGARARSAISKNRATKAHECSRLDQLKTGLGRVQLAAGAAAVPVFTRGRIFLVTAQGAVPWDGRTPLRPGQGISTGDDGYAEVVIPDDAGVGVVRVDANSEFTLADEGLRLKRGGFHYLKEAAERLGGSAQHRISINAQPIVMTIRDTMTYMRADFVTGERMRLAVREGEVSVSDAKTRLERSVKAGQFVIIDPDGSIIEGPAFHLQRVDR